MKTTLRPHFRIRTKFALASTMLLLSMLFALPRARSGEEPRFLYATAPPASGADTLFVRANLEAKRVRVLGNTGYPFSAGLAFCPSEGEDQQDVVAYTIVNTFDPTAQLAKLDQRTGEATLVGSPHGQGLNIMGMTCSPDGTLYAIGQDDPTNLDFNSLYIVERESGLAFRIGSTLVNDKTLGFSGFLMALAFAPDDDETLYGVNEGTLFRVDQRSGKAKKVVDLVGVGMVMGLAIDEDGKFYVADYVRGSKIYTLDLSTGVATPILNTGLDFVHNIEFKQIPRWQR
jgi:DNA-binding beta-propeller fold protein YncE